MSAADARFADMDPYGTVSYTHLDVYKRQKQGRRKGRKDVTIFSMAMANVTGNPKRTIATILTMGLSCVLFVIVANYVGNIDTEQMCIRDRSSALSSPANWRGKPLVSSYLTKVFQS